MNGADRLCDTLLANDIDVCFANPGTSEMHFVAALDRRPQMRCVLGLFEGVVTAAADGYARMAEKPAATLLHTGPGLANGLANLHNARRARTPMVNIVGDHAAWHLPFDAPLTTDIEALARPMSHVVRRVRSPDDVAPAAAEAIAAARATPGVATLILPADSAWGDAAEAPIPIAAAPRPRLVEESTIAAAADRLAAAGRRGGLLLGGAAARGAALDAAGRIAAECGTRLFGEVFITRGERGGSRPALERIPYPVDLACATLAEIDVLVLVSTPEPVAFFGYPGKPSRLAPPHAEIVPLADAADAIDDTMLRLADRLGASNTAPAAPSRRTEGSMADGPLTDAAISLIAAAHLPDEAIVVDEGLTSGRGFHALSEGGARHDYLMLTGGAIGIGIPLAVGAAIARPDRKVVALQADGSGMYTVQGLWTAARENLDILFVIYANSAYAILRLEMQNVGVTHFDRNAERMLRLDGPPLDWVAMARGMGVEAARAETTERFADLYTAALRRPGPFLIEAIIP